MAPSVTRDEAARMASSQDVVNDADVAHGDDD